LRTRTLLGLGAVLGAFAVVTVVAYFGNQVLYLTVDEVVAGGASASHEQAAPRTVSPGQRVQVRGALDKASLRAATAAGAPPSVPTSDLELAFILVGQHRQLPVVYRGLVPDTLAESETITVAGVLDDDGVFRADTLPVQCPSKYQAAPPGASLTPAERPTAGPPPTARP
jgi:cytochrome c-type biogenesis protein CcmE